MRRITRRLTAAVLSACLALAPIGAFAEQPQQIVAQVEVPMSDGTQLVLPVQQVVTSTGETVYWLDRSMLSEDQLAALAAAQLMIYDESGELLGQYLFSALEDGVVEMIDAIDPEVSVPMMLAPLALPETLEQIESALNEYGYAGDDYDAAAEEAARIEAERLAAEEAARIEAERLAAEEAARIEAERLAAEEAARLEAERLAAEEAARLEAERLAAEEAARIEAERLAAEEAARIEAERLAAEEAARIEAERLAAEEAARIEAERLAAEEAARIEAERLAAEEAARLENEQLAAEEIIQPAFIVPFQDNTNLRAEPVVADDNVVVQLKASEVLIVDSHVVDAEGRVWWHATDCRTGAVGYIMADVTGEVSENIFNAFVQQLEDERVAAEQAAQAEADRIAAEQAAQAEADRIAAEQAAQQEQIENITQNIVVPGYVVPFQDNTNLRSEPIVADYTVLTQVNASDVLTVSDYAVDAEGRIWWQATDYRTGTFGFVMADVTGQVSENIFNAFVQQIEADRLAAEQAEADRIAAEQATQAEADRIAAEQAAQAEADRIAAEQAAQAEADRIAAEQAAQAEADRIATEQAAQAEADRIAAEQATQAEADRIAAEEAAKQEAAVRYAVTSNRNNPTNNLRAEADSNADVMGVYENGELLIVGEPTDDGKWYPVTVVRDNVQGYMRDYLLTEISEADAQARMAEILAGKVQENEQEEDAYPELIVPDETEADTEEEIVEEVVEAIIPDETKTQETEEDNSAEQITPSVDDLADLGLINVFPAYAMSLAQGNNAAIVLREEPAGGMPQSGSVPMLTGPTPLEILDAKIDDADNGWYLVRNMNNDETGYIESFKLEEVTREDAEGSIVPEVEALAPVPSDNPTNPPEQTETEPGDEEETQPEVEEIPDTPQELTEGDIYHYGRNTGRQVGLRKEPSKKADRIYNMEKGTVLWVMSMEGDWCHVRTDRAEGYMMAEYVELMDVREEAYYIASIDDPEVAPDKGEAVQPEETDPNYPELIVPEVTPENTDANYPELIVPEVTPIPTQEPTPVPTEEPTQAPTEIPAEPTPTPAPQEIERYAVVTAENTQLRSNPTMDAYLQAEIALDSVVYAMRTEMNADGELWTLIQAEGQWGYVLTDNIRLMSEEEQANYLAALEAAKATPTPTLEPIATPEPTATPAPQRLELYARVINDGTPLRGNPDPNAYLQTILDKETVVFLFQSQIAEDGMMWYLVQHSGQWGYIRADLVRPMGEQETADYLAQLEAELATPTPMPIVTPEPVGPDSTSAYAKLIKDKVNLRRTPSSSGTSLDRIAQGTLLLVMGSEYDGTYTWYQVIHEGNEGYIRSDMAQMLTIAELEDHFQEQMEQAQQAAKPGASVTPNKNNNTDIVINGSQLQDLIPVDNSWTNNVIEGMPLYATPTPDPNTTPTPMPPEKPAVLIRSSGDITVSNVPALTNEASFRVYGKTKAYTTVTATVEMTVEDSAPATLGMNLIAPAIAEQIVKRTVGQAVSGANGVFEMNVTLPGAGEYIVEFANADGAFAQYGVTYDTGATPAPTAQPLPTAAPVQETDGGMGIWPFVIGGLLIIVAAAVYGVYVYLRKRDEDEDEEDEDEETEMRQQQLNMQRQRAASSAPKAQASTVIPGTQRTPSAPSVIRTQTPSYMKNTDESPYARPTAPQAPTASRAPQAPTAPKAPVAPVAPKAPTAPVAPVAPKAPTAPVAPKAPTTPQAPVTPAAEADKMASTPRRRRRPPTDPNA